MPPGYRGSGLYGVRYGMVASGGYAGYTWFPYIDDTTQFNIIDPTDEMPEGKYVLQAGEKATLAFRSGKLGETGPRAPGVVQFLMPGTATVDPKIQVLSVGVYEHDPWNADLCKTIVIEVDVAKDNATGLRDVVIPDGTGSTTIAKAVLIIDLDIYDGNGESRTSLNAFGQYETTVLAFQPRPEIQVPETLEVARQAASVTVSGKALDNTSTDNSVVTLTVNGQQVTVAQDGAFSTQVALDSFTEKVELKATNYYSISTSATIVLNRGSQPLGGGYFATAFVKSQGAYIASAYPESAARNQGLVVENDSQFALLLFPDLLAGSFMSIPQGAQIVNATLELCPKETGTGEETTLRIERLVDPQGTGQWKFPENSTGEPGGDEFKPQVGVSWAYKDSKTEPKIAWVKPGGDVAENGSAEASAETALGAVWRLDATDHVKSWQSGAPNLGWRIRTLGAKVALHSNDSSNTELRPKLTVVYTMGD
jgi:hypothetical protein